MSAWRQAAIDAFPDAKREFLAMERMDEVWLFLQPLLATAVKQKNQAALSQFLNFASWVLAPRPGSRPGGVLKVLTDPVIEFILKHVELLFEGRSRQDFFRIQPGLQFHLSEEQKKAFEKFLKTTQKYVR
ncbi:hypothetical protein SDC9_202096 [bioreactor metagenome]|uniref:Uncharacterized protein n=1 Tax=bioreactor metagenome TaxID=1076179 RepID=A0A645ITD3_9ZZZZ